MRSVSPTDDSETIMQKNNRVIAIAAMLLMGAGFLLSRAGTPSLPRAYAATDDSEGNVNFRLQRVLDQYGFTGKIEQTFHERIETNLGRSINPKLADLGRTLWFDKIHALHRDNTCGGLSLPNERIRGFATNGHRSAK